MIPLSYIHSFSLFGDAGVISCLHSLYFLRCSQPHLAYVHVTLSLQIKPAVSLQVKIILRGSLQFFLPDGGLEGQKDHNSLSVDFIWILVFWYWPAFHIIILGRSAELWGGPTSRLWAGRRIPSRLCWDSDEGLGESSTFVKRLLPQSHISVKKLLTLSHTGPLLNHDCPLSVTPDRPFFKSVPFISHSIREKTFGKRKGKLASELGVCLAAFIVDVLVEPRSSSWCEKQQQCSVSPPCGELPRVTVW